MYASCFIKYLLSSDIATFLQVVQAHSSWEVLLGVLGYLHILWETYMTGLFLIVMIDNKEIMSQKEKLLHNNKLLKDNFKLKLFLLSILYCGPTPDSQTQEIRLII